MKASFRFDLSKQDDKEDYLTMLKANKMSVSIDEVLQELRSADKYDGDIDGLPIKSLKSNRYVALSDLRMWLASKLYTGDE